MSKCLDYNKATNVAGTQCAWCGKRTPVSTLFPIMVSRAGLPNQLNTVCYDCLAKNNVPKGVHPEMPFYGNKGERIVK